MRIVVRPAWAFGARRGEKGEGGVGLGIRAGLAAVMALGISAGWAGCSVDLKGLSAKGDAGALGVGDVHEADSGGGPPDAVLDRGSGGGGGSLGMTGSGGAASGGVSGTGGAPGTGGVTSGSGGLAETGGAVGSGGMANLGGAGGDLASGRGGVTSSGGGAGGQGGMAKGGRAGSAGGRGGGGVGGAPPSCGPSTCADGCCMGATCVRDHTVDRCGMGGVACAACAHCFKCSPSGSCDLEPASTWNVVCGSATISATQANGSMWDPTSGQGGPGTGGPGSSNGELPDPVCQFLTGTTIQRQTSVLTDTLTPAWNMVVSPGTTGTSSAKTLMSSTARWSIKIVDDDEGTFQSGDDICQVTPTLTVDDFRTGKLTFDSVGRCVHLSLALACAM